MDAFKRIYPDEYYLKFLEQNIRPDGRDLTAVRQTVVSVGTISTAHGSAFVKIGTTAVVCGIKAEVGKAQKSNDHHMAVNVELLPLCSPKFPRGKPSDKAQLFCQLINELSGGIVTSDQFKIPHTDLMWYLHVDMYCLDYNGNVLDTCLIALLAAIKNVLLPEVTLIDKTPFASDKRTRSLKISRYPLALTHSILDNYILSDPTAEEEELQTGSITVVVDSNHQLITVFKPGGASLEEEQLRNCIIRAQQRADEIMKLLKGK